MARKSPAITVVEIPGDKYPDLRAAQAASFTEIAHDLAQMMKRLQQEGYLINVDGRLVPSGKGISLK